MKKLSILGLAVLAAGCAETPAPHHEALFGSALRDARLAMTLHPDAGARGGTAEGIDGAAAKETIKRYQDSFKEPPPVTNVINIGGAIGKSGGPGG